MAIATAKKSDKYVRAIEQALKKYKNAHSGAETAVFRVNPGTVYIRIVDEFSDRMSRATRHDRAWNFIQKIVGDDLMAEVGMLLVLSPADAITSPANLMFEEERRRHKSAV